MCIRPEPISVPYLTVFQGYVQYGAYIRTLSYSISGACAVWSLYPYLILLYFRGMYNMEPISVPYLTVLQGHV